MLSSRVLPFFRWLRLWSCLSLLSISSWLFYILLLPAFQPFIQLLLDRERLKSFIVRCLSRIRKRFWKKSSRLAEVGERTFVSQPSNDRHSRKRSNTRDVKEWSDADFLKFRNRTSKAVPERKGKSEPEKWLAFAIAQIERSRICTGTSDCRSADSLSRQPRLTRE